MLFPEILGPDRFAHGVASYVDNLSHGEDSARIYVQVKFAGKPPTLALVDTGAFSCILSAEDAAGLDLSLDEPGERRIGGDTYVGKYARTRVTMEAEDGSGITMEARVFVPELKADQRPLDTLLGYKGFLDRIRFAVDPYNNLFYFASTGDDIDF